MSVTVSFPAETEKQLRKRAAQCGQSVEGFIQQLVEKEMRDAHGRQETASDAAPADSQAGATLDEILAPVREEFERIGMTDDDLASLVEEVRERIGQEKQMRKVS